MQITIPNAATIGAIIRATRKVQKIRQDDAAGSIGVSENFLGKVERGSDSVQWGKLFQVLEGLGVRVIVDVPDAVAAELDGAINTGKQP
ncbi:helix-turn-helix transcriptional regulator [Bordetella sp. 15P40C-2]|uniref:helix-turn-helix domain-containing protein n=1 Tax=Bordetella sp. 15P40C-2 TaxID=2572246 RepID=UPI0013249A17|nr:helix-turn-helix domain-containing protein [Bordetella sp. 15P40C-2]